MSDENPDATNEPGTEPAAPSPRPANAGWRKHRVPLLLASATFLLGCLLGGGAVAIGSFATGDHGEDSVHSDRGRGGHRDGDRDDDKPAPSSSPAASPSAVAPSPSASSTPSPTAS
jgi:hypothetical protein